MWLYELKMQKGPGLQQHVNTFKILTNQFVGIATNSYDHLVISTTYRKDIIILDVVTTRILSHC